MIRQCCRCLMIYGVKEPLDDHRVTHGFCLDCFKFMLADAGLPLPADLAEYQECYSGE